MTVTMTMAGGVPPVLAILYDGSVCTSRFPSDDLYSSLRHEIVAVRVAVPPEPPKEARGATVDAGVPDTPRSDDADADTMDVEGEAEKEWIKWGSSC
jgi:hypothetical protein